MIKIKFDNQKSLHKPVGPIKKQPTKFLATTLLSICCLTSFLVVEAQAETNNLHTNFSTSPDEIGNNFNKRIIHKSVLPYAPLQSLEDKWKAMNDALNEAADLKLSIAFTSLYMNMSSSLPDEDNDGLGWDLDINGKWTPLNKGEKWEGSVGFWMEKRKRLLTDLAPGDIFSNVGSAMGPTDTFDSDQKMTIREAYWQQGSKEAGFLYRIGKFAPDIVVGTISQFDSASLDFAPFGLVTRGSAAFPDPGFAAAASYFPQGYSKHAPHITVMTGDMNGDRETTGDLGKGQLFYAAEVGFRPFPQTDNAPLWRFTTWYSDAVDPNSVFPNGAPHGYGVLAKIEQEMSADGNNIAVLNYGRSWNAAAVYEQQATIRFVFKEPTFGSLEGVFFDGLASLTGDRIGIGFGWVSLASSNARDEYSIDSYYSFQLTPHITMSFDLQYMINPALVPYIEENNPGVYGADRVFVGGVRLRVVF